MSPLPTATRQWLAAVADMAAAYTRAASEKETTTDWLLVSQTLTSLSKPPGEGQGRGGRLQHGRVSQQRGQRG